ncbi:Splicing_factor 3A subunit 2 [Hexamita inflata]|uniref:Splicing factor 3A subunit 2 n=1 Tax=Hexamita inflata TaxID=28002 RepID=A0AA86Q520_9EUKA|nr:Splicing factor 3A subunit 2 [Hexamita inflata]
MRSEYGQKSHNVVASATLKSIKRQKEPTDDLTRINYLGQFECILCGTRHVDSKSLEFHQQGKRHLQSLEKLKQKQQQDTISFQTEMVQYEVSDLQHPWKNISGVKIALTIDKDTKILTKFITAQDKQYFILEFPESNFKKVGIDLPVGEIIDFQEKRAFGISVFQFFVNLKHDDVLF